MQVQEKALWGQRPLHCSHGVLSEKPFNDAALCGGVFIENTRLSGIRSKESDYKGLGSTKDVRA